MVLLGREDLGVAVGNELDNNTIVGAVVVHADVEAPDDVEIGIAVVERGLVEDAGALATLVVQEVRVHAVARAGLGPALGQRHVDEQVVSRDGVTEDHTGRLEHLAILR